jgi:hypothetical protein
MPAKVPASFSALSGFDFLTAASATIRETHPVKRALPLRLPIPSTLPTPQKQRNLQRPRKCAQTHASANVSPAAKKIYTFAAKANIIQVNGPDTPISSCLLGVARAFCHSDFLGGCKEIYCN